MRFPGIRLVEQTEQKFRRFESVLTKRVTVIVGFLYYIKAPTKNYQQIKRLSLRDSPKWQLIGVNDPSKSNYHVPPQTSLIANATFLLRIAAFSI